jgi:hypothetical protein
VQVDAFVVVMAQFGSADSLPDEHEVSLTAATRLKTQ